METLTTCQGKVLETFIELPYATVPQLTRRWYRRTSQTLVAAAAKTLYDREYLNRTKRMLHPMQRVYFPRAAGMRILADYGRQDIPRTPKSIAAHWIYQEHTLAINDVYLAALEVPRMVPGVTLLTNTLEHVMKRRPVPVKLPQGDASYVPDNFIVFSYQERPRPIFVEVDRGTEDAAQWREKIRKIIFDPDGLRRHFGIAGYTIAVTAATMDDPGKRMQYLMEQTMRELRSLKREQWASLFLFTDHDAGVHNGADFFFAPIWHGYEGMCVLVES